MVHNGPAASRRLAHNQLKSNVLTKNCSQTATPPKPRPKQLFQGPTFPIYQALHLSAYRTSRPHARTMIFSYAVRKILGGQRSQSRGNGGWWKLPEERKQVNEDQQCYVPLLAAPQGHAKKDTCFAPRRSRRAGTRNSLPDGDIWVEIVVVTNRKMKNGKKRHRSLFYSINTRKAYWDKPPLG